MMKVTIHATGGGTCSLTGKEGDGLTVSFDDGTLCESFLSWKAFRQLLGMKSARKTAAAKPAVALTVPPAAAGNSVK